MFARAVTVGTILFISSLTLDQAQAAEGGLGTYLLGGKGPAAAVMPDEGWYFQNDFYIYNGGMGDGASLPLGGRLDFGVDGSALIDIPTIIYVSPLRIGGGKLGLSLSAPIGYKDVKVDASVSGPRGNTFPGRLSDNRTAFGDPSVGAFLGWNTGNWHYQFSTKVNVPIGDYDNDRLANLSFNRWSGDFSTSVTWLNPQTGLDISGTLGMTVNGENSTTRYRTGNELHFEAAAVQHFNKKFDAGLVGYHYQQVSADSGEGASGPFKGRVSALGLTAGYNFLIGNRPVSARLKYYKEFNTRNRARGDAVYLTLSFPLSSLSE